MLCSTPMGSDHRNHWVMPHRTFGVLCVIATLCGACSDLEEFRTGPDSVFRGAIVGGHQEGTGDASFVRRGFPSRTELELELAPDAIYVAPGTLKLWFGGPGAGEWHTHAPLVPLAPLAHDHLSQYGFPGEGRLRSYLFGATLFTDGPRTDNPNAIDAVPRDVNVFVSLMADGTVEARLMTPKAELFGVFTQLERHRPR
jgi:hypothetical protein